MKIALIPSNNGLGHINRSIILANYLTKGGFNVTIFCEKAKVKNKLNYNVKVINYQPRINYNKDFFFKKQIHKELNLPKKFDLYLSDNYPEYILNNQKTLIVSNFFWHDILKVNTNYYKKIEKKISERPVIPNYLFCAKDIKKKFKINPVGFYGKFEEKKFNPKRNGILISTGTANYENKKFIKKFVKKLNYKNTNNCKIYIEESIYNESFIKNKNFCPAKFDKKMFKEIAIAIIKPGLGTIRDCLSFGIPIFTYTKNQNSEFKYNSKILSENNLGINFPNLEIAFDIAQLLVNNQQFKREKFNLSKNLRWNGEKQVFKIIKKYFKDKLLFTK